MLIQGSTVPLDAIKRASGLPITSQSAESVFYGMWRRTVSNEMGETSVMFIINCAIKKVYKLPRGKREGQALFFLSPSPRYPGIQ